MTFFVRFGVWVALALAALFTPLWFFGVVACGAVLVVPVWLALGTGLLADAYMFNAGVLGAPWHLLIVAAAALVTVSLRGRLRMV